MRMSASEKDKKQHRIFITMDSPPGKDVAEFFNISNYCIFQRWLFPFYFGIFLPFFKKKKKKKQHFICIPDTNLMIIIRVI